MIDVPLFDDGTLHDTDTLALPAVADTEVGARGAVNVVGVIVTTTLGDVLPSKPASSEYVALIERAPSPSPVVVSVATPPLSDAVPIEVDPSMNVTVPVGSAVVPVVSRPSR